MNTTLVVLAAGMGSRFGGMKQVAAVTPDGRGILDFSCYDAHKAGFDDVVFIVREDMKEEFKKLIGDRIASEMKVRYVIQDTSVLPQGRKKPFGTGHAVLACKGVVNNPFVIINSDDYYGAHAFDKVHEHLIHAKKGEYAMVPYLLGKTLSKNGTVNRGVCEIENGYLKKVVETIDIDTKGTYEEDGKKHTLPMDTLVSMNLWGLLPDYFDIQEKDYQDFLVHANLAKDEIYIPNTIEKAIVRKECSVKAYPNEDQWYGITYREDLAEVQSAITHLVETGVYPKR